MRCRRLPLPHGLVLWHDARNILILRQHKALNLTNTHPRGLQWRCLVWLGCLVALYVLPSLAEWTIARAGSWQVALLMGDVAGCLAIGLLVGWWWFSAGLYAGLTFFESFLLFEGFVTPTQLAWISDLVPAILFAYLLVTLLPSSMGRDPQTFSRVENE